MVRPQSASIKIQCMKNQISERVNIYMSNLLLPSELAFTAYFGPGQFIALQWPENQIQQNFPPAGHCGSFHPSVSFKACFLKHVLYRTFPFFIFSFLISILLHNISLCKYTQLTSFLFLLSGVRDWWTVSLTWTSMILKSTYKNICLRRFYPSLLYSK